ATAIWGLSFPQPVGDAGRWVLGADRDGRAVLWEWRGDDADPAGVRGTLVTRFSAHIGRLGAVVGWPTADGRPAVFIGTSRDTRTLVTLTPEPDGDAYTLTE